MGKATVFFCKEITPENIVKTFKMLEKDLPGKVGIKLYYEDDYKNELIESIINYVSGEVVYNSSNTNNEKTDISIPTVRGKILKYTNIEKCLVDYDSLIVISNFRYNKTTGFYGALNELSLGCASKTGKSLIYSTGQNDNQYTFTNDIKDQNRFLESMADAAGAVTNFYKGDIVFINIITNIIMDCEFQEKSNANNIGIFASLDPVAIDKACIDIIKNSNIDGKNAFIKQLENTNGENIIDSANFIGVGTKEYELIKIE